MNKLTIKAEIEKEVGQRIPMGSYNSLYITEDGRVYRCKQNGKCIEMVEKAPVCFVNQALEIIEEGNNA